jgi:hypothetical protein
MRWDIINQLVSKNGYNRYLEIGVQDANSNYNKIQVEYKQAVDPMQRNLEHFVGTSDAYFAQLPPEEMFDIIFIDGLHHSDQVLRDIDNSLLHLIEGGTIVVHDCIPSTQQQQLRFDNGGAWTGDVWKAIVELKTKRTDLKIRVVDHDWGCGIITRSSNEPLIQVDEIDWNLFETRRDEVLSVISLDQFTNEQA